MDEKILREKAIDNIKKGYKRRIKYFYRHKR